MSSETVNALDAGKVALNAGDDVNADSRPPARGRRVPRLIVSDLDGTFLSPDGTVSRRNAEAVRAAEQAGILVVFATGRPIRWLEVIRDLPGAHPVVIASNGAMLYDLSAGEVLDAQRISVQVAAEAVHAIRSALPDVAFGVESGERVGYEESYVLAHKLDRTATPWVSRGRAEDLVRSGEFVKLLVQHPELGADALAEEITAIVGETMTVTHSEVTGLGLVEISATGVSKASMLHRYCRRLDVDAQDVAAFGDMPNDLEMLRWAGQSYVMADGHPDLDAVATRIGSNADSAVGSTITEWLGRADSSRT